LGDRLWVRVNTQKTAKDVFHRLSPAKDVFRRLSPSFGYLHGPTVCKCYTSVGCLSCPVCLSCLSVTFVHCGQTVGRIKMKLGM